MTGFIERASCDIYCFTDVGRVKSKDKPTAFNSALEAFTLGLMSLNDDVKISAEEAMQVESPQEEIENNFKLLNSQLGGYLIKAIRNSSPWEFRFTHNCMYTGSNCALERSPVSKQQYCLSSE